MRVSLTKVLCAIKIDRMLLLLFILLIPLTILVTPVPPPSYASSKGVDVADRPKLLFVLLSFSDSCSRSSASRARLRERAYGWPSMRTFFDEVGYS